MGWLATFVNDNDGDGTSTRQIDLDRIMTVVIVVSFALDVVDESFRSGLGKLNLTPSDIIVRLKSDILHRSERHIGTVGKQRKMTLGSFGSPACLIFSVFPF